MVESVFTKEGSTFDMAKKSSSEPSAELQGAKPTGKTRLFLVTIARTVEMTLDTSVITQGLADRGYIMNSPSEEEVLKHLAFNLVGNQLRLSDIDGYANCPDASAVVEDEPWEVDDVRELKSRDQPKPRRPKAKAT